MYAARASQFAKTITMACSVQRQPQSQPQPNQQSTPSPTASTAMSTTVPTTPKATATPRGSLPSSSSSIDPTQQLEFQWPPIPVSTHTSNLRLNMMNQNPKDLHTARLIIEELRAKVRYQTEHILKWRKAYAIQIQQHYRYQKEKTEQMNALTSQLLLLESRLKRKQKQIANLLNHRELTILRQQKIIDTLSSRLVDHGLETIEASYANELDSLNDSDSAVVLEDIDSDSNMTTLGSRRRSSGGCGLSGGGGVGFSGGSDGITIVRSISDAIETNLNKYGGVRRNNCFLRRPEILETVYSVEEDPEPTTDVAEKRDKFKNRSEKVLSSSSTEGQIDNVPATSNTTTNTSTTHDKTKEKKLISASSLKRSTTSNGGSPTQENDGCTTYTVRVPQIQKSATLSIDESMDCGGGATSDRAGKSQVTNFNRVMSNHRSVTKPKDVKYKRINKAKSKSLEELRGRLKNLVERGTGVNSLDSGSTVISSGNGNGYAPNAMAQTAQSYA